MFMSTAFHETRTDRSPIPLKGGTFGMDRNVCGFTQCNTGPVFLTVTSYYFGESDLKNPLPAVSDGLGKDVVLLLKILVRVKSAGVYQNTG